MRREAAQASDPAVARQLRHFVRVTRSYRPGLFGCYQVADLPRTNNDLEHLFGSHRYHERRASGCWWCLGPNGRRQQEGAEHQCEQPRHGGRV